MSYDVIRTVRQLKDSGIGDADRLSYILDRLENGMHLYLSDQRYLESLLNADEEIMSTSPTTISQSDSDLGQDLREINLRLEKIFQNKIRNEQKLRETRRLRDEQRLTSHVPAQQVDSTSKPHITERNKVVTPKSEGTALALSVIFGLTSLQGLGHIYIGKTPKGAGLLILSVILTALYFSQVQGLLKNLINPSWNDYSPIVLFAAYFGLYVFQIFDSRKLCKRYNTYVIDHKNTPPWW